MAFSSMSNPFAFSDTSDGITLKFPAKLWRIVNSCQSGSIGWMPDGGSIRIEKNKFEVEYLNSSRFFKTTNFPSFIRQLNIYGFKKVPAASRPTRWLENSANVFEYRHDYFLKGHPELLPEVRRNTAVRRTQRENALRDAILADTSKHFQEAQLLSTTAQLTCIVKDTGDVTHPLLKATSVPKKPLVSASVNRIQPRTSPIRARAHKTITTVFMNPQTGMYDMQHISAARIQNQMTGLLPAIVDEEAASINRTTLDKGTSDITTNVPFPNNSGDATSELASIPSQILFLPKNEHVFSTHTDQLSQESSNSQHNTVMFPCPIQDEAEDEIHKELTQNSLYTELEQDVNLSDDSNMSDKMIDDDMDVFTQHLNIADTLSQFGDEQGYLAPAYFDPDTGLVTLLLPTLSSEN